MEYSREDIIIELENYNETKEKIALLQFELENPNQLTADELLSAMALGTSVKDIPNKTNTVSDKTMRIALSYTDTAAQLNSAVILEIRREISVLESKIKRLEFYLSFLDEESQKVIRYVYVDKYTWQQIEDATGLSRRTLSRRKNEAIDHLVKMYNYVNFHHRN